MDRESAMKQVLEGLEVLKISSPEEMKGVFAEMRRQKHHLRHQRSASWSLSSTTGPKTVCIYDLETTGLGKTDSIGIVELGAIVVGYTAGNGWAHVASFHRLW